MGNFTADQTRFATYLASIAPEGETILFVAEKMAALDVVHKRLRAANLGPYCLELHSQATRKSVASALKARLEATAPASPVAIEDRRRAIERGKASLDCLDQLRLDILEGELNPATASRLAKLLDEVGGESLDPELRETVEEIRFRLRFEAARLARGGRRGAGG